MTPFQKASKSALKYRWRSKIASIAEACVALTELREGRDQYEWTPANGEHVSVPGGAQRPAPALDWDLPRSLRL
jgi:hypothetical protein